MSKRTIAVPSRLAGYTALLLAVLLVSACSSSASSSAAASSLPSSSPSASSSATAIAATCEQVSAVLGDGPDPDADPVGFAEAHILLLRQINTPDQSLRGALSQLAEANQSFVASNGKSANAKEAVAVADKKINSICPGAAS
jgi:hypothetical protein